MMKYDIEKLIEAGANRWTKNGKDRVYLSNIGCQIIGLELGRYKSGNICSASLNGESISNGNAHRVMEVFRSAYVDVATGELCGVSGREEYVELFEEAMEAYRA